MIYSRAIPVLENTTDNTHLRQQRSKGTIAWAEETGERLTTFLRSKLSSLVAPPPLGPEHTNLGCGKLAIKAQRVEADGLS